MSKPLESVIERYFYEQCKQAHILCFKFVSPGHSGVPDRLLITEDGLVFFCELKRPDEEPRRLQEVWIKRLLKRHVNVFVCDSKDEIDAMLAKIKALRPVRFSRP